jgi:thiol-disulfide isomerase/thioredoxin
MNLKRIIFSVLLCVFFSAGAQIKNLVIGDLMPDLKFEMLGYKEPTANLSDFKGKLLILDFWATWCSTCIKQFPKLDSLQNKFSDKIMVLPVGFDARREGSIKEFLVKRNNEGHPIDLPTALQKDSDSLLMKLIPFFGLPHEVWIDSTGRIIAITDGEEVSEKNISNYFQGKLEPLPLKYQDPDFDDQKPLLVNGNGGLAEDFVYRSIITNYNAAIAMSLVQENSKVTRIGISNRSPMDLIKEAFGLSSSGELARILAYDYLNKRVSSSVSVLNRLTKKGDNTMAPVQRKEFNLFCYDLTLPEQFSRTDAGKKMLSDLETFFRIKVSSRIEKVNCLLLVRTSQKDKVKSKSELKISETAESDSGVKITNSPIKSLVGYFNRTRTIPLVIDKTGYNLNVDIDLEVSNADDLDKIRKKLRSYDLDLLPVVKELEMLVLKENSNR